MIPLHAEQKNQPIHERLRTLLREQVIAVLRPQPGPRSQGMGSRPQYATGPSAGLARGGPAAHSPYERGPGCSCLTR